MRVERVTLTLTPGDNFAQFPSASGGRAVYILEGSFNVQDNGIIVASVPRTSTPEAGQEIAAGSNYGLDRVQTADAAFRLDEFHFKNATAGQNGTVVFLGVVASPA